MSFSDWLLLGGAALLIHYGLKKESATEEIDNDDIDSAELDRRCSVNDKRKEMPCFFLDGLTQSDFQKIARRIKKRFKRIKEVDIDGAVLLCNVVSQTGFSDWNFSVDFNDWGHVTGTYWMQTDNADSSIPHHYGQMVSEAINDFYRERGISIRELSNYVDKNKDLETAHGFNYKYKERRIRQLFGEIKQNVSITYGTLDLLGEHLYPVISMLLDSGFRNIKTFSVQDINDYTGGYYYQVAQVLIDGNNYFAPGMYFPADTEVLITYHEKQTIRMPYTENELKRKDYITVGNQLQKLGFTQIYERKIEDLITGWVIKEGSVENVLLEGENNQPILKNSYYDYDQKIVICYHTKKS